MLPLTVFLWTASKWLTVCALLLAWANTRVRGYEAARPGSAGLFGWLPPVAYVFCLTLWPLAFVVAWWMLRTPALARQGRVTLVWGIFQATLSPAGLVVLAWVRSG